MNRSFLYFKIIFLLLAGNTCIAQNENSKWYFGNQAGLDFMTNPPTALTNGVINTFEGCSGISDAAGNLLFYTDGITVWNASHTMMSNGGLLNGNSSTSQAAVVVKQPGNPNIYFIFTLACCTNATGVNYSVVDMSLSSGSGSVTIKNVSLAGNSQEKLTSVRHCNGTDIWVLSQAYPSGDFRAHLVSAAGVSTTPVMSAIGSNTATGATYVGYMKFSPNGKKLGVAVCNSSIMGFDLYDFNASTGIVSNRIPLLTNSLAYGVEFSPDGTKMYGALWGGPRLYQWDLCAGSGTAIVASQYTTATSGGGALQLGINGKIYMTRDGQSWMGVVANPNVAGSGCNYSDNGQSISPKVNSWGLPNFITSGFKSPPIPFTHTLTICQTASFTAPPVVQNYTMSGCAASGYSLMGIQWNFGDPITGSANTSTLTNPSHMYSSIGSYTPQLVLYYSCGGGTDTIKQVVNINQPCITVNSTSITCASLGSATVQASGGIGPYSYTWTPTGQTNPIATGLSPGIYSITVFDQGNNFTYTATTLFTSLIPLTGMLSNSSSLTCYGAANGTAAVIGLSGGSGNQNYLWTNGTNSYTVPNPTNLTAGNYTFSVTDALTGCNINGGFFISQPPTFTVAISANSPTVCAGLGVALSGTATGGSMSSPGPGYNYSWTAGPAADNYTPTQIAAGPYVYTLSARDANNCLAAQTITINVIPNPVLTVYNALICPLETGTLTVSGASSYTWNGLYTGSSFTHNPITTTQYTVLGAQLGCSSVSTGSIILKSLPIPTLSTNGPRCNGDLFALASSSAIAYQWTGPLGFNASIQNPVVNPIIMAGAGVYNLTVTAANGCTASVSNTLTVFPTPTLSASGSTVCTGQLFGISASSGPGASYAWSGPLGFNSSQQNNTFLNAAINQSGPYTLTVSSVNNCTNTATALVNIVPPPVPVMALTSASLCAQGLGGSPNSIGLNASGAISYTITAPNYMSNINPSGPSTVLSPLPPYLNTGPVTVGMVGSNGVCTANTWATFTIVSNPVVNISNPFPVICAGQSFTYNSSGADTYTWSAVNPAHSIIPMGSMALVNPSMSAVFSVMGSSLGCNSAPQNSTLTVNPLPQFTIGPNPAMICIGDALQLGINGTGTSYTWSPPFFLNTINGPVVTANPPARQNYTVVASLNNCTLSAGITVSVMPAPVALITAPKTVFCAGDSVVMFGSGGISYAWSGPTGLKVYTKDMGFTALSGAYSGIYTLTVSDQNNCRNITTQALTIYNAPQGYLSSANMKGCAPLCADLLFKPVPGAASVTAMSWQVENLNFYGDAFKYCFDFPGNYKISGNLTDLNNCVGTLTAMVTVYPKPLADFNFSPEQPIERLDGIQFSDVSKGNPVSYYWEFGNKLYTSSLKNPVYNYPDMGTYPVALIVQNQWQCSDTVLKTVTVHPDFGVYVPNSFTPNDDGLNESFGPVLRGAKSFNFSIYNRWGEKLFETSDLEKGWDGSYKGKACKEDVYVWKLLVISQNEDVSTSGKMDKKIQGTVLLYR